MIHILRQALIQIIADIDSGNCHMTDSELQQAVNLLQQLNTRTQYLNRTQAADHLHLTQRTFDRYVHEGRIPPGQHHRGDRQKTWSAATLDHLNL